MFLQSSLDVQTQKISTYTEKLWQIIIDYSPKLISAFIILFVGLYLIRIVNRLIRRIMLKRELDPTLSKFLADIFLWILRAFLFVAFISKLGIETSSFVAILGAAGLAVGLSLQGSLSNFAGGMLIILFKPFRVGDYIEAQNVSGEVSEIQIFVTKIIGANNQTIYVPNGALSNGTIVNLSQAGIRRVDLSIAISYNANLLKVKEIIERILSENPKILTNPVPRVDVIALADHVKIAVRPWVSFTDYPVIAAETLEKIKLELDAAEIALHPVA
ncbi:mechanosensitive ion channel domain-containing protein [Flavobacterium sp.]|uniref:mechanosensitive ion channel family protein n=1 Tax=Flavobacterium sp. TaxID=239 RepID=UPI002606E54E|nr:mechanosensitive ion channel domain-containing protein [Flavobacterium sp.]